MASIYENVLYQDLLNAGMDSGLEREYRFDPERKFAADLAYPGHKILIEVEGGTRIPGGGRHNRADGFETDCQKYNRAQALGYKVLRYTVDMIARREPEKDLAIILKGGLLHEE